MGDAQINKNLAAPLQLCCPGVMDWAEHAKWRASEWGGEGIISKYQGFKLMTTVC